jgi:hypothetical protein
MLADTANGALIPSKQKSKALAESNGWSVARAQGYVNGELFRRRGKRPPYYLVIGIDEYCLGFREGYFERNTATPQIIGPRGLSAKGRTA